MFPGEFFQVELVALPVEKAFVEKSVESLCDRTLETLVKIKVDALQISGPETFEDGFIPGKGLKRKLRLAARLFSRLFPLIKRDVVQDMKFFIHPAQVFLTPPGVFVIERYPNPAIERFFHALIAFAFVSPAENLNKLVASE